MAEAYRSPKQATEPDWCVPPLGAGGEAGAAGFELVEDHVHVAAHGGGGGLGITLGNRGEDVAVAFHDVTAVVSPVGQAGAHALQVGANDVRQAVEKRVAGGLGDGDVEGDVRLGAGLLRRDGGGEVVE